MLNSQQKDNSPDAGEYTRKWEKVLEIPSALDDSRDPDLLREVGRVTAVRPLVTVCSRDPDLLREVGRVTIVWPLVTVCRRSNEADRSRDRVDWLLRRDELLTAERLSINQSLDRSLSTGLKKTRAFLKSPTQWVLLGFLDKQEKIGKIIQKLSNLKP